MIEPISYYIPTQRDFKYKNCLNQPAEFYGRVQYNLKFVKGPCLWLNAGDTLDSALITDMSLVSNAGTCVLTPHMGYLQADKDGTVFALEIDDRLFPCIEFTGEQVHSTLGDSLKITSNAVSNWTRQDDYFFEAVFGYWLKSGVHYPYNNGGDFIKPHTWNNANVYYEMLRAPDIIGQDLLEGPFWFTTEGIPIPRTQAEIANFAQGKTATFFCPDEGKGLAIFDRLLTGQELEDVRAWFEDCSG